MLKLVGLKTALRLGWRYALYPRLKDLVEDSYAGWDDKLLKFVDDNIHLVINKL